MNVIELLKAEGREPFDVLFGTDWWTDCDDVGALSLLLNAHKAGIIRLCCVGINSVMDLSAASVDALCAERGLDIPIGIDTAAVRDPVNCRYQKPLAEASSRGLDNGDCPEAYKLYRSVLADSDGNAVIVDVGFPEIIMQLLMSPPDGISPLPGVELVRSKVREIRLMAGDWSRDGGREYNLSAYPVCGEAGDYICRNSPVPVVFLGYEVGEKVICGGRLDRGGLAYKAYAAHGHPDGRCAWDPMTALAAVIDDDERAGYRRVTGTASVDPDTGCNHFTPSPDGKHSYLVMTREPRFYSDMIDEII